MQTLMIWFVAALILSGCVAAPLSSETPSNPPTAAPVSKEASEAPSPRDCQRVSIDTPSGPLRVAVEVAATPEARRRGLMGRQSLEQGRGMLFVFDKVAVQTFWMRNTPISLDMIFISGEPSGAGAAIVGIVHEAEPRSHEIRSVDTPSRFVLEVPGGWSKAKGLHAGMKVHFERDP